MTNENESYKNSPEYKKLNTLMLLGTMFGASLNEQEREACSKYSEMVIERARKVVQDEMDYQERVRKSKERYDEDHKPLTSSFGDLLKQAKKGKNL